jgi:hypothetical protein
VSGGRRQLLPAKGMKKAGPILVAITTMPPPLML